MADCIEPTGLGSGGICRQRLWRSEPGEIWPWRMLSHRSAHDVFLPIYHHRYDLEGCCQWVCRNSYRSWLDPDPPRVDPGDQYTGQPGAKYGPRLVCRW